MVHTLFVGGAYTRLTVHVHSMWWSMYTRLVCMCTRLVVHVYSTMSTFDANLKQIGAVWEAGILHRTPTAVAPGLGAWGAGAPVGAAELALEAAGAALRGLEGKRDRPVMQSDAERYMQTQQDHLCVCGMLLGTMLCVVAVQAKTHAT